MYFMIHNKIHFSVMKIDLPIHDLIAVFFGTKNERKVMNEKNEVLEGLVSDVGPCATSMAIINVSYIFTLNVFRFRRI